VLEVKSAVGRLLNPDDDNSVAVVSYGLRRRKFGGDPSIIGARIRLNGSPFTVIGVAGENFRGTVTDDQFDVWVPIDAMRHLHTRLSPGILEDRAAGWIWIFGRLNTGISLAHARVESQTIAAQLAQAYPATNDGRSVNLARGIGMYPDDRAEIRGLLGLLSGAVAVLLLISCANVAGLFLVRASRRSREIAVRLAVGAGRARLLRQFATEGLLLAAVAGCVGLLFSEWVTAAVVSFGQRMSSFRHLDFGLDGHMLAFTMVCCAVASLLFALAPVTHSTKVDLTSALRAGGSGSGYPRTRLRSALVAGQVALSFILLSASGVLLRDLLRILATHPGFETKNIALMSIDLTSLPYSREKNLSLEEQILEQVAHLPGVVSATLAGTVPPQDLSGREPIFYPGQEPPPEVLHGRSWAYGLWVDVNTVAPNYFETLRIPLLHGRDFSSRDRVGAPGTVILSEKLAQRLWPSESAIGKHDRVAGLEWSKAASI
jgi:predicted permease